MPRYIIKLEHQEKEYYLEYSSVVDAPVTYGMNLKDFKRYYKERYGTNSIHDLKDRLKRVEKFGTSCFLDSNVDDTILCNRAGENGENISKDQLIKHFCVDNSFSYQD